MTDHIDFDRMPSMHEVLKFMRSNPLNSCEMLIDVLKLGDAGMPPVSASRFRELWKLAGGEVDKKGHAWVEADYLPQVLGRIINVCNQLPKYSVVDGEVK